ncbi:receptor for retinol uptake stra6 [Lingula anatina]|uniref:Receptor for retinol uptake STRA6 n=1 Tax=Lingula anatina TaxID=7574 RepID=A0A1S3I070_LINAN|nr:receptor for retinol uptake stra6 [Lingula anatina]XP_013391218.1 receptor for retinol uptake stra6 [Lingula anatina]XP_013391219.1 receptor for retinol uptake stra6 [Lingula anatina]XP_013391220.1 receptor for retinol uptake stra6 [Lingula anatina]XP_013391221.1 receptor for retinol uptake stra6 [Lingula anatina]|eukprot:XP_013391217.1 receptor for retinol uptake stra6 [Lingula anatina]
MADNTSNGTIYGCPAETAEFYITFQMYLLICSAVILIIFSFTTKRTNLCTGLFQGRPGLITPMNYLESPKNRWAYTAAYGVLTIAVLNMILTGGNTNSVPEPSYIIQLKTILLVLLYGLLYYPVLAAVTVNSILSYTIGWLHLCLIFGVQVAETVDCALSQQGLAVLMGMYIPSYACVLFLLINFPVQTYRLIRYRRSKTSLLENGEFFLKHNYEAKHVCKLFNKNKKQVCPESPVATDKLQKLRCRLKSLWAKLVYQRVEGYVYSTRIVTTFTVAVIVIYAVAVLIYGVFLPIIDGLVYNAVQRNKGQFDSGELILYKVFRVCFIVSIGIAFLYNLLSIAFMLDQYRKDHLDLQKGIHTRVPPMTQSGNIFWMMNFINYAGYQVAYLLWGFFIQSVVILIIVSVISLLITILAIGHELEAVLKWTIGHFGPSILILLVLYLIHFLLSWLVFLQDKGANLAANNRRLLFNFVYFMFIYNILIGAFSALLRVGKGIVFGVLYIGRLDSSNLPRSVNLLFDPGYRAYVGMLHVENAHRHPVMLTFINLLVIEAEIRKRMLAVETCEENMASSTSSTLVDAEEGTVLPRSCSFVGGERRQRARRKWAVLFTVLNNPSLAKHRKTQLQKSQVDALDLNEDNKGLGMSSVAICT